MKKCVVIGLSGGVDSSVAAYILKQQDFDVIGLFMINWHDTTGTVEGDCPWHDDLVFAELTAKKLDIPFYSVDFSEEYRKRIVNYMFKEYEAGRTPNPDVLCNREVKFDLYLDKALELGADYIATGHYCRKEDIEVEGIKICRLLAGLDKNKDQSYFLCQVSQQQLNKALFPIGHMQKPEVRKIAQKEGLAAAERKDSQGLCFIGKVHLPEFLQQKLSAKKGYIFEIPDNLDQFNQLKDFEYKQYYSDSELKQYSAKYNFQPSFGTRIAEHNGAHFYTIGQNKGLNIGGRPYQSYVIGIDTRSNVVYTGLSQDHPGLYRHGLFIENKDIHWIREDLEMNDDEAREYSVRIRYRQQLQKARLFKRNSRLYIIFKTKQRGITSGQFAAWYDKEELIGSGVIG